jgi:hypothetical protein
MENREYWKKQHGSFVQAHEIICPYCQKPSGYTQEGLMFFVITYDLCCKHCGKIVITKPSIGWKDKA